jgi:glycosyltransferase involved in cell wall biosynthesis
MFSNKTIAVVMPAHNEARLIVDAVTRVPDFVDHVIVVDDASTDRTLETLDEAISRPGLICLRHPENLGVGAAIVSGYRKVLELGADIAAVMAGDAQMDPRDLPKLLRPVINGTSDYAKGDRLSWPGVAREMPLVRFIGNHVLSQMTRLSSGYSEVRDSQCGYTAVTRDTLNRLNLDALYKRYGYPNDMLAKLHAVGGRLTNVVVRPIYDREVSGISLITALFRVPLVLLRSFFWRLREERRTHRRLDVATLNSIDT